MLIAIYVITFIYYVTIGTTIWQYACAIPRLPLFLLGLTCAIKNKENISYYVTIPLFALGTYYFFHNNHYMFSSCCILLFIQIANKIIDNFNFFNISLFYWIGNHTLEIYVANVLSSIIIRYIFASNEKLILISSDMFMTIIFSLLLWKVNNLIQKQFIHI